MKPGRVVLLFIVCFAPAIMHAQNGPQREVTGRAEVKKTAAEQLAYARRLINTVPATADQNQRIGRAMDAVTALRVIPDKWPTERAIVTESLVLQASVWRNENFPTSALEALRVGEQSGAGTDAMARIYTEEGFIYRRLGRLQEAASAFDRSEHHPAFHALPVPLMVGSLSEYADVESKLGRPREASAHLRNAAELPTLAPINRLNLILRSFDENDKLSDKKEAKKDLGKLDDLLIDAKRQLTSAPADVAAVYEIEKQVKQHKKRLGV